MRRRRSRRRRRWRQTPTCDRDLTSFPLGLAVSGEARALLARTLGGGQRPSGEGGGGGGGRGSRQSSAVAAAAVGAASRSLAKLLPIHLTILISVPRDLIFGCY